MSEETFSSEDIKVDPNDVFEIKMYSGPHGMRVAERINVTTKGSEFFGVSFLKMVLGDPNKAQVDLSGEFEFPIEGAVDILDAFNKFTECGNKAKTAEVERRVSELKQRMSKQDDKRIVLPGNPGFTPPTI